MQAPFTCAYRSFIIALGVAILSECFAFADSNDRAARMAEPSQYHGDRRFGGLILRPGESGNRRKPRIGNQQDRGQDKIGRNAAPSLTRVAPESVTVPRPTPPDLQDSVCLMIEAAGRAHDLPAEFFARVIWQESRFNSDTMGPRRRNGERAQGIAQFMPSTAVEKGLLDPFDPVQALPKAAQFLRELKNQFGNLGLAAAAYNAGPARVRAWLSGVRTLPVETRKYVVAVTGAPADDWAKAAARKPTVRTSPNCGELMALLQQPGAAQAPRQPHNGPAQSPSDQLAKTVAAPSGPEREDLVTAHYESSPSREGLAKEPDAPKDSPSRGEVIAKGDPVAEPSAPVQVDLVTPHQKDALPSRKDVAKQSPSNQDLPLMWQDEPMQRDSALVAKNDPVAEQSSPAEGDVMTPQQEALSSRVETNLFIEKLTERVRLTADSPWGIQLSAGFSRERVLAAYTTIASRYAEILAGKDASILSSVFRSRGNGAFYQIRSGTETLESADNLCAEIRHAGGACMVLRNRS